MMTIEDIILARVGLTRERVIDWCIQHKAYVKRPGGLIVTPDLVVEEVRRQRELGEDK